MNKVIVSVDILSWGLFMTFSVNLLFVDGSRKIAPEENCAPPPPPPAPILTLILNQTLTLAVDNFPHGQFSGQLVDVLSSDKCFLSILL